MGDFSFGGTALWNKILDQLNGKIYLIIGNHDISRVASELLPEVDRLPLPQAVIQLILRVQEFEARHRSQDLMQIAQDGRIDPREREIYDQIVDELEVIVQAAMQLKFAKPDE